MTKDTAPIIEKESDERRAEREARKEQSKKYFKHVCVLVAKNTIVCLLVVAYAILGGYAYRALEAPNEKDTCFANQAVYDAMENNTAAVLWAISRSYQNAESSDQEVALILAQAETFFDNVLSIGYDGTDCTTLGPDSSSSKWNFWGALLFSVTVFTTIGYGNIAPITDWGRITTIAYAMVGLPLMFYCLANIGEILAEVFRFVYLKICCLGLCARKKKPAGDQPPPSVTGSQAIAEWKSQFPTPAGGAAVPAVVDDDEDDDDEEMGIMVPMTVVLIVIATYLILGAILFSVWQGWTMFVSAYYCFITISTIGLGDLVPGFTTTDGSQNNTQMVAAAMYMLFGMALMSMGFDLIMSEMGNKMGSQNIAKAGDTINELEGRESPDPVTAAHAHGHHDHGHDRHNSVKPPPGPPPMPMPRMYNPPSKSSLAPPGSVGPYQVTPSLGGAVGQYPPTKPVAYDPFRPVAIPDTKTGVPEKVGLKNPRSGEQSANPDDEIQTTTI